MTKNEISKLTPEQKRATIARACGVDVRSWYCGTCRCQVSPCFVTNDEKHDPQVGCGNPVHGDLPDYLDDLNACAEMEKSLTSEQAVTYRLRLMFNSDGPRATHPTAEAALCHASASQRADAFLRTVDVPMGQNKDYAA